MKKVILTLALSLVLSLMQFTSFARIYNGDSVGEVLETDIRAYINGYPIDSYNIRDNTAIVAEDLNNYGFEVIWDEKSLTLKIARDVKKEITPSTSGKDLSNVKVGRKAYDILFSNINVYIDDTLIPSFNIDGKTAVYIDSLGGYGSLVWKPENRAIYLELNNNSKPSEIPYMYNWIMDVVADETPIDFGYIHKGISGWTNYMTEIEKNSIGTPELKLVATNLTNKAIDSFEFTAKFKDSFGDYVNKVGTHSPTFNGVVQDAKLKPREDGKIIWKGSNWNTYTFNLVLYNLAYDLNTDDIVVTKIKFSDGTIWER